MARIAEKDNPADVLTNFVSREDFLTVTAAVLALRRQRGEQPESPSGERLERPGAQWAWTEGSVRRNRITSFDDDWLQ